MKFEEGNKHFLRYNNQRESTHISNLRLGTSSPRTLFCTERENFKMGRGKFSTNRSETRIRRVHVSRDTETHYNEFLIILGRDSFLSVRVTSLTNPQSLKGEEGRGVCHDGVWFSL